MCDAAERVAPHRNEATLDVSHVGERRRHQNGLIDRTAHRGDAARPVLPPAHGGEVPPKGKPKYIWVSCFPSASRPPFISPPRARAAIAADNAASHACARSSAV